MNKSNDLDRLEAAFQGVDFTDSLRATLSQQWKLMEYDRHSLITEAGRQERYFYFVLEGVQALTLIDQKGEKVVLGFSFNDEFSGVFDSFLTQQPAQFFLEALTPSRMLAITFDDYKQLFADHPSFNVWARLFFQRILIGRVKREVELLTLTAEERYIRFLHRCPPELQVIPQKYLASYLNMTPETFSRLRGRVRR